MGSLRISQTGQAATEFIIAAAFILVPLFLIIPLLGKYIDIKHAAIGQARFSAWEYTVWGLEDNETGSPRAGKKSYTDTIKQGTGYYFGNPAAADYGTPGATVAVNPLWQDHRGIPLFGEGDLTATLKEDYTPAPLGVLGKAFEELLQFLHDIFALFGRLLKMLGVDADFDANDMHGYFTSKVEVRVNSLDRILPEKPDSVPADSTLAFKAKAGVLTDNWNASSRDNATSESRGLVVTSLLAPLTDPVDKALKTINRGLAHIPLFDIKLPALPSFGYVEDDLIPFEHLNENKKKLQDKQGLNSYEEK